MTTVGWTTIVLILGIWAWVKEKKAHKRITDLHRKRIWFLERHIKEYYMANWHAKENINPELTGLGVCGISVMEGNEESVCINDVEGLKQIINDLPLHDCGC